jgi:hypothetical protein
MSCLSVALRVLEVGSVFRKGNAFEGLTTAFSVIAWRFIWFGPATARFGHHGHSRRDRADQQHNHKSGRRHKGDGYIQRSAVPAMCHRLAFS